MQIVIFISNNASRLLGTISMSEKEVVDDLLTYAKFNGLNIHTPRSLSY